MLAAHCLFFFWKWRGEGGQNLEIPTSLISEEPLYPCCNASGPSSWWSFGAQPALMQRSLEQTLEHVTVWSVKSKSSLRTARGLLYALSLLWFSRMLHLMFTQIPKDLPPPRPHVYWKQYFYLQAHRKKCASYIQVPILQFLFSAITYPALLLSTMK